MEENLSKNEQERLSRLRSSRIKKVKTALIWLVVLGVIGGLSAWAVDYSRKAESRKPGAVIPDIGALHIPVGSPRPDYNSNPPTSGPHYGAPAPWGIYDQVRPDEELIHNLEHGGIWISYRDLDDAELIGKLKDVADDYKIKLILTPRPQNDSAIAVAAWGRLLKLDAFDEGQIKDFIKAFINKGPEKVPF